MEIKGYTIVRELGLGGMATVYLAIQKSFEREVALKIMSPALSADSSFGERFIREAKIVSRLVHPNIVTVYDVGVDEGHHFLSMEFIPGKDLRDLREDMSLQGMISVLKDMGKALDFAGRKGYVHRDVKPANIMLHAESGRAVLMDFGIAKMTDINTDMTQAGSTVGTPHYMSPEQARGKPVDGRSDIYSLGVVFYWMLLGRVPYSGDSAVAVGIKHISSPVPLLPQALMVFQEMLEKTMAKKPADRFQTGQELVDALERLNRFEVDAAAANLKKMQGEQEGVVIDRDLHGDDAPTAIHALPAAKKNRQVPGRAEPKVSATDESFSVSAADRVLEYPQEDVKKPRGVSLLILLLFVCGLGVFVYLDPNMREKAQSVWQELQVLIDTRGDSAASENTIVSVDRPVASAQKTVEAEHVRQVDQTNGLNAEVSTADFHPSGVDAVLTQINGLLPRLGEDLSVAREISVLYRQILNEFPENGQALAGYDNLQEYHWKNLERALEQGGIHRGRALVDSAINAFPGIDLNLRFQLLQGQLGELEWLEERLATAEELMGNSALTTPENDNAYAKYREILEKHSDNVSALAGIQQIAERYLITARAKVQKGQFVNALKDIKKGLSVDSEHQTLLALEQEARVAQSKAKKILTLNQKAESILAAGELAGPSSDNAVEIYRQVLSLSGANSIAREGLEKIESAFVDGIQQSIESNQLDGAARLLTKAKHLFPENKVWNELTRQHDSALESSIQAALEASAPRVSSVRVSHEHLVDANGEQVAALLLQRTLHVAFHYENFQAETTVVQAILRDGSRSVQIAQIPVIIDAVSGTKVFRIERPVEGFPGGGYHLELVLNGKRMIALPFSVTK